MNPSASRRHGSFQWSRSGQDVLANRSANRCTENFNPCASNRTDGTNHLYHPRFWWNGPSQLLYPVFILSLIVLNIVWLEIFLYKSPYKRLELFAEAVRKALLASGHLQTQNCKARVVRGDKNSIHTAAYLKGEPCAKKNFCTGAIGILCSNREPAIYTKSHDLGQWPNEVFRRSKYVR